MSVCPESDFVASVVFALVSVNHRATGILSSSSQIGHGRHHDLLMLILSPVRVLDHADLICTVRVILNDDRGTWSVCHVILSDDGSYVYLVILTLIVGVDPRDLAALLAAGRT